MRFTLVHGGFHGAWCWEKLIPELEALGHQAVAMDLPGHGARQAERSSLAGYRDAVLEVLRPDDVLVGHSMGCHVASMAADALPTIRHIIYLAGPVPVEGKPMAYEAGGGRTDDDAKMMGDFDNGADRFVRISDDGQYFVIDFADAVKCFYHDCDVETARRAYERLTPQLIDVITSDPISIANFWKADLPRSFIRCRDDQAFPRGWSQRQIERLGVVPIDIAGSHSPFLSRPAECARLLVEAVHTRPVGPLDPGV